MALSEVAVEDFLIFSWSSLWLSCNCLRASSLFCRCEMVSMDLMRIVRLYVVVLLLSWKCRDRDWILMVHYTNSTERCREVEKVPVNVVGGLPVGNNNRIILIISSISLMRWQMFGVVRVRLLHQPWVYAVVWGPIYTVGGFFPTFQPSPVQIPQHTYNWELRGEPR